MIDRIQAFVYELILAQGGKIVSIGVLGSRAGEQDLSISDIDFLIVANSTADIPAIFNAVLNAEQKIFGIETTKLNARIEKNMLASISYKGVHPVILGRDEFDANFQPISLRLKFLTKLVGRNLFLHEMKQEYHLLSGEDVLGGATVSQPGLSEKISCFLFPSIVLLAIFPAIFFSKRTFRIWCFKAIKYHHTGLKAYMEITGKKYPLNKSLLKTAHHYRYKPEEYSGTSFGLYFKVWRNIIRNLVIFSH